MDRDERLICPGEALPEGGKGVRFRLNRLGGEERGFAVRYDGEVRAYVNECPHAFTQLDWNPGEFFDEAGLYLVCATHGAMFEPHTGLCVVGPCRGAALAKLSVREREGAVYLLDDPPLKKVKETDSP